MSDGPYKRHEPVVSEARFNDVMSVAARQSVVMTLSGDHLDKVTFNRNRLYRFAVMRAKGALKRAAGVIFNTTSITLPRCVWRLCHKVRSHANMLD
jgi:hypothetical protein